MAGQPGSRVDIRWIAVGVAAAGLGAIALASRGSGVFGRLQDGTSPLGSTIARAALGLVAGVAVGFGLMALLRSTNHRHGLIGGAAATPSWRRALLWSLPLVVLLGGLGAAAAASTSKLEPRQPATADQQPKSGSPGRAPDGQPWTASFTDLNGDGKPDLDANGRPKVVADLNGDGIYESELTPCPGSSSGSPTQSQAENRTGRTRIGIDIGCDGTIDRTLTIRSTLLRSFNPASSPTGTGQQRGGSQGSTSTKGESINRKPNLGNTIRIIAILLLAAGLIGLIILIVKSIRGRHDVEPTEPLADLPASPSDVDHAAAASTLADTIDTVLADPDPRRAIVAAYATLLDGLAAAGLPRLAHEAPREHLERCLSALAVRPAPMRALVDVFQLARFSTHPVGEAHRAGAVGALRAAQDDLAAIRSPVAAGAE